MEIGPEGVADPAAFEARRTVVSEAGHDPAQRQRAFVEDRPAGVVLEADDRPAVAGVELALDQHVADETPVTGHCVQWKDTGAGLLAPRTVTVVAAEQLVATADGERYGATGNRLREQRAARSEIGCDECLLTILATSDVEEVGVGRKVVPDADFPHVQVDAAALRSAPQHRQVASIGVDVQKVRIEMREHDPHATRSQYGRA